MEAVKPDYAGPNVTGVVPALLGVRPVEWMPAPVAGARSTVLLVLDGLEEFREHLGGELTITLLKQIGKGFEVHEMSLAKIMEAIYELKQRHDHRAQKILRATG